jgi:ankyrin repeat protein
LQEKTPLHLAVEGGHMEAVKVLLEVKADFNAKTVSESQCDPYVTTFDHFRPLFDQGGH